MTKLMTSGAKAPTATMLVDIVSRCEGIAPSAVPTNGNAGCRKIVGALSLCPR
jgi:hypothetical protein